MSPRNDYLKSSGGNDIERDDPTGDHPSLWYALCYVLILLTLMAGIGYVVISLFNALFPV